MVGSFFFASLHLSCLQDVGIVGHLGLDVHCGVVGNIQAFHVCAPGSIPGNGIFSQSSLWLKSSCSMHASMSSHWAGCVIGRIGLGILLITLLKSQALISSYLISSYLILS